VFLVIKGRAVSACPVFYPGRNSQLKSILINQYYMKRFLVLSFLLSLVVSVSAQVAGKVTDAAGQPLTGVSVFVKGTSTGAVTDLDGNFKLASRDGIAVFSYTGFATQEIPVDGRQVINVTPFPLFNPAI
jgi:hypothetical protein